MKKYLLLISISVFKFSLGSSGGLRRTHSMDDLSEFRNEAALGEEEELKLLDERIEMTRNLLKRNQWLKEVVQEYSNQKLSKVPLLKKQIERPRTALTEQEIKKRLEHYQWLAAKDLRKHVLKKSLTKPTLKSTTE